MNPEPVGHIFLSLEPFHGFHPSLHVAFRMVVSSEGFFCGKRHGGEQ